MQYNINKNTHGFGQLDVLLVQRSDISFYPPTVNQANLLAEAGLRLMVIDGGKDMNIRPALNSNIMLERPLINSTGFDNFKFSIACRRALRHGVSVCIAYDSPASVIIGLLRFAGIKIFHFHEYPLDRIFETTRYKSPVSLALYDLIAIYMARRADCVSMPDGYRAATFFKENSLKNYPLVVNNCSRSVKKSEKGLLRAHLASLGLPKKYILMFQGAISSQYCVDEIVLSMYLWPEDSVMVFAGSVTRDLMTRLKELASAAGCAGRLVFLGKIPHFDLLSYTVDADVMFTLIRPVSFNFMHMAGASNKRYEAIACGVPQISNTGPGMIELIEGNGVGLCVDSSRPDEIGRTVGALLVDSNLRAAMSISAIAVHQKRLNYEYQFSTMLEKIKAWCKSK